MGYFLILWFVSGIIGWVLLVQDYYNNLKASNSSFDYIDIIGICFLFIISLVAGPTMFIGRGSYGNRL